MSPRVPAAAALALLLLAVPPAATAQDLEPRLYANTPVGMNFLITSYSFSSGGVATDASIPLTDAEIDVHLALLAYARAFGIFGKSAKFDVILPYGWLDGTASFQDEPIERQVDGLADPRLRVSVNLLGAPAMSLEEWRSYQQDIIVGASLQVSVPLGQYDDDKIVNLGTNRWFFKPEFGVSKAWGPLIVELSAAGAIYTDNDDFFGGRRREQEPVYSTQAHVVYSFWRSAWAAFDATWYGGGRSSIDGKENDDRLSNTRLGLTIAAPVSKNHSLKLYGSTAVATRTGSDFDTVGVAWQVRWGGGL